MREPRRGYPIARAPRVTVFDSATSNCIPASVARLGGTATSSSRTRAKRKRAQSYASRHISFSRRSAATAWAPRRRRWRFAPGPSGTFKHYFATTAPTNMGVGQDARLVLRPSSVFAWDVRRLPSLDRPVQRRRGLAHAGRPKLDPELRARSTRARHALAAIDPRRAVSCWPRLPDRLRSLRGQRLPGRSQPQSHCDG